MPSRWQQPRLENANPRTALFAVIPAQLLVKDQLAYCATSYDRFALADLYDTPTTVPAPMNAEKSILRLEILLGRISAFRLSVLSIEHSARGRRVLAFAHAVHRSAQANTARTACAGGRRAHDGRSWKNVRRRADGAGGRRVSPVAGVAAAETAARPAKILASGPAE